MTCLTATHCAAEQYTGKTVAEFSEKADASLGLLDLGPDLDMLA